MNSKRRSKLKGNKCKDLYYTFSECYYKTLGIDYITKQYMVYAFFMLYIGFAFMFAHALYINVLFYQVYAYIALLFISGILIWISYMDAMNDKLSEREKTEAMDKAISTIIPNYIEKSSEEKLVIISYLEEKYRDSSKYKFWLTVGKIMRFGATLVFELFGAYTWYIAGTLDDFPLLLFVLLILIHVLTHLFGNEFIYEPVNDRCKSYLVGGYKKHIIAGMISRELESTI